LFSVFNTESVPFNTSSYFQLTSTLVGDFNYYNVSVTSNFINNIYYGSNQGARVWNFRFKAVVNGIESFVDKTISLNNVDPIIDPAESFTVDTDGSDTLLTTITATNGASLLNPQQGKELTWSIVSGNNLSYFSLSITSRDDLSTCRINNNQVNTLPAGVYPLVIRVTDAGGDFDEITVTINASVQVNFVKQYELTVGFDSYFFTMIQAIDGSNADRSGFYVYLDSWSMLSLGLEVIELNYTASAKFGCPTTPNKWIFKDTEEIAYAQAVECLIGSEFHDVEETNQDFTSYRFEIV
jgi:hypothetical protein